ncbi:MAG: zinc-ribbon domain-containing protein [Anaerolineae bacterium]|nr:zinc-ribbon domain-containing protein [Anaerolineae bacterium]
MFLQKVKCAACGASIDRGVAYCPQCGAPQGKAQVRCGHCGREMAAGANFCPYCGRSAGSVRPPDVSGNRWRRGEEDFATRILIDDVRGFFAREVVVEPGTQAIILADGANLGVVGPGKYTIDTLVERAEVFAHLRSAHRVEVILVDAADTDLEFRVARLFTTDPLPVDLTCRVVTRVGKPVTFLRTLMKGQRRYGLEQLRDYLYVEVQNVAAEWIGAYSVENLATNLRLRDELEVGLEAYLRKTLERTGLELVQVRAMDFVHEYTDRVTGRRAEAFLQLSEEEARLDNRKRLFEVLNQQELQELAEETEKVKLHEERARVWDRMRQAVLSDKMAELETEEELEVFLREQDKRKLLRDKDYEELKRTFAEQQEDHELQRRYVLRQVEMERQKELDRAELAGETELLQMRLDRRDMELRAQLAAERLEALERKKTEVELRQQELSVALQEARTQAEFTEIQREQDRLDGELGVYLLELMDERKLKRLRGEQALEMEREEQALERRLREGAERHRQEIERLQTMGELSAEVLITMTGPEQARILAGLKETEVFAGMNEEQILARIAERSPEVARAFQERFRGLSAEKQAEMYERMLADKEGAKDELREVMDKAAQRQQDLAYRAMETQRDVSVAYAQKGDAPIIVTPGAGGAGVVAAPVGGTGRVVVCPRCHLESAVGTKFCQNCGYEFFGAEEES